MKTCYYSDELKKYFDDQKSCELAEQEYQEKHAAEIKAKEEKAAAAKEVENLYKEANEKYKEANKALNAFVEKYGAFHASFKEAPTSLFDTFFNKFWF